MEEQDELSCDELLRQQVNSLDIDDELLLRLGDDSEVVINGDALLKSIYVNIVMLNFRKKTKETMIVMKILNLIRKYIMICVRKRQKWLR